MTQKLTRIIQDPVSPETAISPIQTKKDRLLHVWIARNKKAARTRKRLKLAREAAKPSDRTGTAA
jgi:hypothetical protein